MKQALIVGNGPSRKGFDLNSMKGRIPIFGCNALYRDFEPDYLVAIDDDMISEIQSSDFPQERFILPPIQDRYEPQELHGAHMPPRSNAGAVAVLEAVKRGHKDLYLIGFDFLIADDASSTANVYHGTQNYGPETHCNLMDSRNRFRYFDWILQKNQDVYFSLVFPPLKVYGFERPNFRVITYENFS